MFIIKELTIMIAIMILAVIAHTITKNAKINDYNYKKFQEQLNWYHSYYGDEHTSYLMQELKTCSNPYKLLNEIMKNLNPELVNENISD